MRVVLLLMVLGGCSKPAHITPLPLAVLTQSEADADRKSAGCISCHKNYEKAPSVPGSEAALFRDEPTMHGSKWVKLGCTDCHGGSAKILRPEKVNQGTPDYYDLMNKAHVQPRYPEAWRGKGGRYSSANPKGSYTLLNKEDPAFVRFVNPGDLRVAREVCGPCHLNQVNAVERHTMTTTSVFWSAAAYNNGIVAPAIGAQKIPFLGESYTSDGKPREIIATPEPSSEEQDKGVLPRLGPLPRWETLQPGDIFRVFEPGGRAIGSSFPDIGSAGSSAIQGPAGEEPGKPEIRQSNRGPGTGLRIAVPVLNLHKTRLNDPHLSFLGTNDNPGDFRSSGCTACHVIYANDRDSVNSGPYSGPKEDGSFGNRGLTQTSDPTIPKDEGGHPLRHTFTRAIPTSQCMVCHMHQPNVFVNSFLGYTMWDYETDGELMWPKKQKYPTAEEIWQSQNKNPEAAAARGEWSDPEFLASVRDKVNPQAKHTQFADYHGHGWNFRAVFKRNRKGELLDDNDDPVKDAGPEKLKAALKPHEGKEWEDGRPGIPVHLKDIHLEKGMHCVDCHFSQDVHGNGKMYGQYADAITISCIDCHGTIDRRVTLDNLKASGPAASICGSATSSCGNNLKYGSTPWKQPRFEWREKNEKNEKSKKLIQHSMLDPNKEWEVVQVADTVDLNSDWAQKHQAQAERSRRAKTMQRDGLTWGSTTVAKEKLAHSNENVACYTCHLSWTTSCAGCHLPIQANWSKTSNHYEGEETRNWATYNPQVLRDDQFILGVHGTVRRGGKDAFLVAPVRSSSALVLSSENTNRERIYIQQPPISASGYSSQAFNPHFPHTVRARETKKCSDCHISKTNDNNAWLGQVLGQGTNFPNFLGRYIYVGEGAAIEAVPVTEWEEPQAVIGSYLHKLAYPDAHAKHKKNDALLTEKAKEHSATNVRSLQMRGEFLYTANGKDGFRVFDIANVDNKGFSEPIVTSAVSPIGERTHVPSKDATAVALPTTMPVSPSRQERQAFVDHKKDNQEQPMHPLYRYAYVTDRYEGLIVVDIETLADGNPDNNFLQRATTFNPQRFPDETKVYPEGVLAGARNITIAGIYAFISCDQGLVIVSIDNPLNPEVVAHHIRESTLDNPTVVAVQFRYAFVLDRKGMKVLDITFPTKPAQVAELALADARDVYVARGYAYIAAGKQGLAIVDIERPEHPSMKKPIFNAGGQINDAYSVRVGSTNASLFAYIADGKNGLRVLQLTSPLTQPNYYGFNPEPVPELIATYRTHNPAIALSKGLDRDRAVDESGNQVSVFGRLGSRPFNLAEQKRMYLRNDNGKESLYCVFDDPPSPRTPCRLP